MVSIRRLFFCRVIFSNVVPHFVAGISGINFPRRLPTRPAGFVPGDHECDLVIGQSRHRCPLVSGRPFGSGPDASLLVVFSAGPSRLSVFLSSHFSHKHQE